MQDNRMAATQIYLFKYKVKNPQGGNYDNNNNRKKNSTTNKNLRQGGKT